MDTPDKQNRVVFEGEQFAQTRTPLTASKPTITQWLVRNSDGLLKNEQQAQYVVLGCIVLALIVSGGLLVSRAKSKAVFKAPPGYEVVYPVNAPPRLEGHR